MKKKPLIPSDLEGQRVVVTNLDYAATDSFNVASHYVNSRLSGTTGVVTGAVPGHHGEVFWVKNGLGLLAPYGYWEFDIIDEGGR
jgi:hypothetical protein